MFFHHSSVFIICMCIENRQSFRCLLFDHTIKGLYDHLTETLAGAHDIRRIHRFICTNQNKSLTAVHHCRISCLVSTDRIILNRLTWTVLHQRNMLMCCCMIDDVRTISLKYRIDPSRVSDRSDQYNQIKFRILFL